MPALLREMLPLVDSEEESCYVVSCLMEKELRIVSQLTINNKLRVFFYEKRRYHPKELR